VLELLLILVPPLVIGFILLRCGLRLIGACLVGIAMSTYAFVVLLIGAVVGCAIGGLAVIGIIEAFVVRPLRLRRQRQQAAIEAAPTAANVVAFRRPS
jgi:hypothetical protein